MTDTTADAPGSTVTEGDVVGEKNAAAETVGVKCVLLDIEGTICPISFVKDTLFPYALKALPNVLATKWNDEDFKPYRDAFPEDKRSSPATLQAYVEELTKEDRKDACHKALQGYLWENGYKTGAYATPLFPDVAPRLKQWKDAGLTLAIYSSGSVFAQKLLFQHVQVQPEPIVDIEQSDSSKQHAPAAKEPAAGQKRGIDDAAGTDGTQESPNKKRATQQEDGQLSSVEGGKPEVEDLQYLISDWFDTMNAGPKKEEESYEKIAASLKLSPSDMLFLTDSVDEYDASVDAGLKAGLLMRPGNPRLRKHENVDDYKMMWSLENVNPLRENHGLKTAQ